jgi:hypothetical protein
LGDDREITRETIVATRQSFGRSAEEVARDARVPLDEYLCWEAGEFNFGDPEVLARIERAATGKENPSI